MPRRLTNWRGLWSVKRWRWSPSEQLLRRLAHSTPSCVKRSLRFSGTRSINQYGSREVSNIACEIPGIEGLWVAPWGSYVEILDDEGLPVHPGEEGNIVVVTCLTNYAMPLLRYWIGDRGALLPEPTPGGSGLQILKHVSGRNVDVFRTRDETLVDGEYFTHLLYFQPWVWKFQVIQKGYEHLVFKVVEEMGMPLAANWRTSLPRRGG